MTLTERVEQAIDDKLDCYGLDDEWASCEITGLAEAADAAVRATLAALREYRPLSGWTGTAASFLDAFEREHGLTIHRTIVAGNGT